MTGKSEYHRKQDCECEKGRKKSPARCQALTVDRYAGRTPRLRGKGMYVHKSYLPKVRAREKFRECGRGCYAPGLFPSSCGTELCVIGFTA